MKFNIWKDAKLHALPDLLEFIVDNRGKTVPTDPDGEHVLIATNCIRNENLYPSYEKIRTLNDETYQNWFRAHPEPGDIIFVNKGTPGRVCMVPDPVDFCIAQDMVALRVDSDVVYNKYLLAVLRSEQIQKQITATTVGDVIPHFKKQQLKDLLIPVPPMDIQKCIGDYYYLFCEKEELNKQVNKNLELQVQTLFRNQFLTQEFLPDGWTRATLGEVSLMGAGGDKPKTVSATQTENCPYPIYSNGISDEGLYGFTNEYKIKDESITVSARGTIGFVCLRHIPYTPIVRLITLIPKTDVLSAKYLYLWLRNTHIHGTGTTQQQLTVPDFRKTDIILPTKEEMTLFTDTITPLFEAIWENQAQNLKLSNMRDTLLPKLMSGELDISNLDL